MKVKASRHVMFVASLGIAAIVCRFGILYMQPIGLGMIPPDTQWYQFVLLTVATLCGVCVSTVSSAFNALPQEQRIDWGKVFDQMYRPKTFLALALSPVILIAFMIAFDSPGVTMMSYLSAFQNAFFWERIFANRPRSPQVETA